MRYFPETVLDSSSFSLFHSGQAFYELVCSRTVVLPQIFFSLTTDIVLSNFLLPFFMHFLMLLFTFPVFLRSFRLESLLSQFSSFVAQIKNKNFCNDQELFLPVILVAVSITATKQKPYQKAYLLTKTEKRQNRKSNGGRQKKREKTVK